MSTTATETAQIISPSQLLNHWQGHRALTRRVIDAFPENEFFEYAIGGMRSASQLTLELLAIGAPALKAIVERDERPYAEEGSALTTKAEFLQQWDASTAIINTYFLQIPREDFSKTFNLFGQYNSPIIDSILYFIDNEIHHRGQMYVYLRGLGIEPPFFWER
ncbi:MAG: damage-inducible protein DinB [Flavobacterium sp. BFFFF1]|uniref:DinB family protein n=1 Tax=Flavobacterium sp. BFFFF1 TaxID=2015557 RepID=UPI000BC97DC4|nr:DinB family protein [Flavobacterium sp. BFFFF1]OYU82329.1 MAG: damage-inducible protein DinB [Flavobacterium sp. BFFFF1]